jgi:hypothetical protein
MCKHYVFVASAGAYKANNIEPMHFEGDERKSSAGAGSSAPTKAAAAAAAELAAAARCWHAKKAKAFTTAFTHARQQERFQP